MQIKYPRAKPYFSPTDKTEILSEISDILDSGMLTQGKHVKEFEDAFSLKIGTSYAIATNSCTSALQIGIESLGIKGNRILVPTQTWMSSVNAIILSGNTPVIIDIDPDTLCMDANIVRYEIEQANLRNEKIAILWVHMAGLIAPDILDIKKLCQQHDFKLIEDCAHAHGAQIDNINAGNIGDVGCFSFYPTKVMSTGEGGMITTNEYQVSVSARQLRDHGTIRNPNTDGLDMGVTAIAPSQNFRMTEMAAILGKKQLNRLDSFLTTRNLIANWYKIYLDDVSKIQILPSYKNVKHSYWNFYIILDKSIDRYSFAKKLLDDYGIQTANAYDPPCHKQKIYEPYLRPTYMVANTVLNRHISLPMYVELTEDDVVYITNAIKEILNEQ